MNIKIALAGNPNCGKTTLFNALTGMNQYVGNWPGVTVEKKEGKLKGHDGVIITDLPGIYSLSPYTLEEVVARNYLINERPNVVLNIVDGTILERGLYLTTQLREIGIPVVVAVNMMDILRKNGDVLNLEELSKAIGCPVCEISALKSDGLENAVELAINQAKIGKTYPKHIFSGPVEHAIAHIEEAVLHDLPEEKQRWYAIKIFERDSKVLKELNIGEDKIKHIEEDIKAVEAEFDDDAESIITNERYVYITSKIKNCYINHNIKRYTVSDKIDSIVTNRFLALPIFAAIMFLVYYISVTTVGTWVTDWTNDGLFGDGFEFFGVYVKGIPVLIEQGLTAINCAPWLISLLVEGIVGGVGAVLGFVPQIFVLFIFLAFLEACGYMSRIAFIMDKIFRKFGLSGKSFIPLLIGTGCSVPGIMASRTIENENDRRMTIITTSFVPCGAKLPIIALISATLFGGAWWVAPSAYFMGIVAVILSGLILKKTKLFAGEEAPFVMELPAYHMPPLKSILSSMWERGWSFIKKAGTIILLSSVLIWALSHFGNVGGRFGFSLDIEVTSSILGYLGNGLKWIFIPLGFGEIAPTISTVMGLIAKEEIVSVLEVLGFTEMSKIAGYSFLMFNLLCAPCFAAMGAIKREMNSGKWTAFAIGYQTALAYSVSLMIYQFGMAISGNINVLGFIVAVLVLLGFGYLIFRPKFKKAVNS